MAQTPDKGSFLNKLAKFVTNPTTDWKQLDSALEESHASTLPPQAVLSQIEQAHLHRQRRKRDRGIRVREFAELRSLRSGVTGTTANSFENTLLNRTSRPKAPAARADAASVMSRHGGNFKVTEINKIEQQMTDQWWEPEEQQRRNDLLDVKTQIMIEAQVQDDKKADADNEMIVFDETLLPLPGGDAVQLPSRATQQGSIYRTLNQPPSPQAAPTRAAPELVQQVPAFAAPDGNYLMGETPYVSQSRELPRLVDTTVDAVPGGFAQVIQGSAPDLQETAITRVDELPEALHEPAILFAQGKDEAVETALRSMLGASAPDGVGEEALEASLALLDLYRATRAEDKFEAAAIDLVQRFGRSAPQYWQQAALSSRMHSTQMTQFSQDTLNSQQHWTCPLLLDMMGVLLLRTQLGKATPEVLLDWRNLRQIDVTALQPLLDLLRDLAERKTELIMWGGMHLLDHCNVQSAEATDDALMLYWLLRLELVRIMQRQEDFDSLALEYCLALEESPPQWVRTRCEFIDADPAPGMDVLEEEVEEKSVPAPAASEEKGNRNVKGNLGHPLLWTGDIKGAQAALFQAAVDAAADAPLCEIDCIGLDRMDYLAAADLLTWLMARKPDDKEVRFVQVHRLLAVFWRIMGITAQARVELRHD